MTKEFLIKNGQTVVFVGDSITDCGRRETERPYGNGYAKAAMELITARYPERRITYFNEGIGGNTVEDLRLRWHDDVLVRRPDWITVKIGINDLHRNLADPEVLPPKQYEAIYREILALTTKKTKARLVLVDPFYISTDHDVSWFRGRVMSALPAYLRAVAKLAKEFHAFHVRTHERFQKQLKYRPADVFCPEPVHPNLGGHYVIALGILEALGW